LDRVKLHELEAMRRYLSMSPSLSVEETLRLVNTLSEVLAERAQMERKLAALRPTWGRRLGHALADRRPGVTPIRGARPRFPPHRS
jgi:hypothetical protein